VRTSLIKAELDLWQLLHDFKGAPSAHQPHRPAVASYGTPLSTRCHHLRVSSSCHLSCRECFPFQPWMHLPGWPIRQSPGQAPRQCRQCRGSGIAPLLRDFARHRTRSAGTLLAHLNPGDWPPRLTTTTSDIRRLSEWQRKPNSQVNDGNRHGGSALQMKGQCQPRRALGLEARPARPRRPSASTTARHSRTFPASTLALREAETKPSPAWVASSTCRLDWRPTSSPA